MTDDAEKQAISVLAGTKVLGVDAPEDRAAVERRFAGDDTFTAETAAWEARLAPLAEIVPPAAPSPDLWARIAADTVEAAAATPGRSAPAAETQSRAADTPASAEILRLRARVRRWRFATAAASALAASLAAVAVVGPRTLVAPEPAGDRFVGIVNTSGELPPLVVSVDLGKEEITVRPVALTPPAGKSYELWAVPANAKPVSLGLASETGRRSLQATLPEEVWRDPSLLLAVSIEPEGGSPTGQPTGQVVYTGKLIAAE